MAEQRALKQCPLTSPLSTLKVRTLVFDSATYRIMIGMRRGTPHNTLQPTLRLVNSGIGKPNNEAQNKCQNCKMNPKVKQPSILLKIILAKARSRG
jgi:hypothetical protein